MKEELLPIVIKDNVLSAIYTYYQDIQRNDTSYAYAVYLFLYKTARIQNNIRVYADDVFIRKGVAIGEKMLKRVKADLVRMKLIEYHQDRTKGVFSHKYIEVKYVWTPKKMDMLFYQEQTATTRYKIARGLLFHNFDEYEEITISNEYDFIIQLNNKECNLSVEYIFIDGDMFKAKCLIDGGNYIDYLLPTTIIEEIILDAVSNYKFSFDAIFKTLC